MVNIRPASRRGSASCHCCVTEPRASYQIVICGFGLFDFSLCDQNYMNINHLKQPLPTVQTAFIILFNAFNRLTDYVTSGNCTQQSFISIYRAAACCNNRRLRGYRLITLQRNKEESSNNNNAIHLQEYIMSCGSHMITRVMNIFIGLVSLLCGTSILDFSRQSRAQLTFHLLMLRKTSNVCCYLTEM